MEVSDLLTSQKRWGRERCRRLLVPVGIPENKQIGTLTERQRTALADGLAARGVRAPAPGAERRLAVRTRRADGTVAELLQRLVHRDAGPHRGQLEDVAVGIAQVDRLEVGAVEHLGALHAA